jgi:hypothetical protein
VLQLEQIEPPLLLIALEVRTRFLSERDKG